MDGFQIELDNSQAGDTFRERIDVPMQPNGAHIGSLDIGVRAGSALAEEILELRDRVAELERENAELRANS